MLSLTFVRGAAFRSQSNFASLTFLGEMRGYHIMALSQISNLMTGVRFPLPAPYKKTLLYARSLAHALLDLRSPRARFLRFRSISNNIFLVAMRRDSLKKLTLIELPGALLRPSESSKHSLPDPHPKTGLLLGAYDTAHKEHARWDPCCFLQNCRT